MASEPEPASVGPETYNKSIAFEDATTFYSLPNSSLSAAFSILTGPEKIEYLKTHGEKLVKKPESERGRIMIHHKGSWIFWNEGQIEYLVPTEDENGEDSEVAKEFQRLTADGGLKGLERREWVVRRATRIREWPEHIKRLQSIDGRKV